MLFDGDLRVTPMKRSKSTFPPSMALFGVFLCSVAACSPPAPAETASQPKPKQVAIAAAVQAVSDELPEPPSANVARPGNIIMTGRLGDPVNDLAALKQFVPAPSGFAKDILENPRNVVRIVFGALGGHIKLDQPIDIALFSPDTNMSPAFSFQLHEFPRTRQQLYSDFTFTKGSDGGLEVTPKPGAAHAGVMAKANLSCGVYSSAITSVYHLVCSEGANSREIAGKYLAQIASRAPVRPGIHFDVHESFVQMAADRERVRLEKEATSNSSYDKGQRMGGRLVQHAFEDMQFMGMHFVTDSNGVHGGFDLGFKSARSPLSIGILGSGTSGTPTPPEFFRIPSDADLGFYFPGASRAAMRPAAEEFWTELAAADFDQSGVTDLWRQFIPKVSKVFLTGGPSILAHGPGVNGPVPVAEMNDASEAFRIARNSAADWTLIGAFEPLDSWTAAARNLLQKPTIFTKRSPAELARPNDDRKIKTVESTEEIPIVPADGLPTGSMHIAMTHVPNAAYRSGRSLPLGGPYTQHFFIAGSKTMTWIVFSDNVTLARNKLAEVLKTNAPGLTARKDLESLRTMPAAGIGFANVASFAMFDANRDTLEGLGNERRTNRFLTSDSGGTEPILFSFVSKNSNGATVLSIDAHANAAIMQTFIAWLQFRPKS